MGIAIIRFKYQNQIKWGVKEGNFIKTLTNAPDALKDLLVGQKEYLTANNYAVQTFDFHTLEILPPVTEPVRIICQGLNYASHRKESALQAKASTNVLFSKDSSSLTGAFNPILRPKDCECLDYEVELGIIIKKDIFSPINVNEQNLHEYVAGIVLANDISPRDLQYRDDYAQWFKAKSCRTMLPLGPILYLMEKEDFQYLDKFTLKLWVNEQLRQNASTDQMIFKPAATITEISQNMNLSVGDVILTGTPGGVVIKAPNKFLQGVATWVLSNEQKINALRKKKAEYLQDGDIIKCEIISQDGKIDLGKQSNKIVSKL